MWKELIRLSEDSNSVIAQLPDGQEVGPTFGIEGLTIVLNDQDLGKYFFDEDAAMQFVVAAREGSKLAYEGMTVALKKDAEVEVVLDADDMLATMKVTGAYGGRNVRGPVMLQALAESHVTKGINKQALKRVLSLASSLGPGEVFEQPVAQGKPAIAGADTQFIPLVEDVNERVLAPQERDEKTHKVDMRDLGETITVAEGEAILRRIPATSGREGFTVKGTTIPPKPGVDTPLKEGKGSFIDRDNPNLLRAAQAGMPLIKKSTIDVDTAITLKNIDVSTGHVRFKGSLVITGNIEPGMIVRATGSITVGGFIESADVQAQEDIVVGKGIIGPAVDEGEDKACVVKTNGNINSKYAQYAFLQAMGNVNLELHCISCTVMCTENLTVIDAAEKKGTLSGGVTRVGGSITCVNLGVEGDTVTRIQPFVRYNKYKQGLAQLRDRYTNQQDKTMKTIRVEIEHKKLPKSEQDEQEIERIQKAKQENSSAIEKTKAQIEHAESELERLLTINTVVARAKVFTRVTVQYGNDTIVTKREHGPSTFSYDQQKIHCATMVEGVEEDENI